MDKNQVRLDTRRFLENFGENIRAKFSNICAKTGQYDVPDELYQKRTPRSNRVLIEWKVVKDNNLTIEKLKSFEGGVAVEFVNNDFFDESNFSNPIFQELKSLLGSDEIISSIISIRSESGSSSSEVQRQSFKKLINGTKVVYKNKEILITKDNYQDFAIKQIKDDRRGVGTGNQWWSGFLFVSIKGGQQDTIETHRGQQLTIFNPACEFATREVCIDIDLVMMYFAIKSLTYNLLDEFDKITYDTLLPILQNALKEARYKSPAYEGNLLDYCENHFSLKLGEGHLVDPIQLKRINIENFNKSDRADESVDFTHNEAVIFQKYYWDEIHNCILTPSRPTNIFWSYKLSNMMQQNYSLEDYFKYEEERYRNRERILKKKGM